MLPIGLLTGRMLVAALGSSHPAGNACVSRGMEWAGASGSFIASERGRNHKGAAQDADEAGPEAARMIEAPEPYRVPVAYMG